MCARQRVPAFTFGYCRSPWERTAPGGITLAPTRTRKQATMPVNAGNKGTTHTPAMASRLFAPAVRIDFATKRGHASFNLLN